MKLRYVGASSLTFITGGVGEVMPGAEFTVPDELASAFTGRSDVIEITVAVNDKPLVKNRRRGAEPAQPDTAPDGGAEMKSEENGGIPDNH